jgi:hypothetical protein
MFASVDAFAAKIEDGHLAVVGVLRAAGTL